VQGRVLSPSSVSRPTGMETAWEDQYQVKLDDDDYDDNDNDNNNTFKYVLISTVIKFRN
jgi:hypothetical protein